MTKTIENMSGAELSNYVENNYPEMLESESYEEYRDRTGDNTIQSCIDRWWELQD